MTFETSKPATLESAPVPQAPVRPLLLRLFAPEAGARERFTLAGLCALFGLAAFGFETAGYPAATAAAAAVAVICGGWRATRAALRSVLKARPNIDFLMMLAAAVSIAVGHWDEAVILLFLFSASGAVEHYALHRTRGSIHALMKLRPDSAWRVSGGAETLVPVEELAVGDVVRVRPGDRLPVDGKIIEGTSAISEALLTGESLPVEKTPGAPVFAGTINAHGSLLVRMTHPPKESTLQRIVELVERAQASRGTLQRVIERWETPYVFTVLFMSLATFALGWIISGSPGSAVYRAMLLLVAASPCAVILATPTAVLATVTRAARMGILFKGGLSIERLAAVNVIAFDKTGTLTQGEPVLETVEGVDGQSPDESLAIAAAIEQQSEHPLAKGIVQAATARGLPALDITQFSSDPGIGVYAHVQGQWYGIGALELFRRHQVDVPAAAIELLKRPAGETAVLMLARDGRGAVFILRDQPRASSAAALEKLRAMGIRHFVMLTGDRDEPAQWVAQRLGITDVRSALRPEEKLEAIRGLAERNVVAMVGDGVNDAPALATATVGVAMGAVGSDVAIETADVVLMRDDLNRLADALHLARRCRRGIRQSLAIALGMITMLVTLTLIDWLPLPLAVIGHEGSTLLVVLNGLRLIRVSRA